MRPAGPGVTGESRPLARLPAAFNPGAKVPGKSVRRLGYAVVVMLLRPLAAGAQATPAPPETVLARIETGKVVRARLDPGRTIVGVYSPLGDGRLGIRTDAGDTETLRLTDLRELSVRGRHTKTGAIIGGVAGIGLGVFVATIVRAVCDAADCDDTGPYLVAVPLFGAGGGLLGAAIGAAIPKWKRVYP